jgi:hypothetical protein
MKGIDENVDHQLAAGQLGGRVPAKRRATMYDNSPAFQSNDSHHDENRKPKQFTPVIPVYVPRGADPEPLIAAALAKSTRSPAEPAESAPKPRSPRRARAARKRRKRPEPRVRYKRAAASPDDAEPLTYLERHEAKCTICNHEDREEIDEDFVHWLNPFRIAARYTLHDRSAVYRHARATGLYELRRTHMQFILEHVLEQVEDVDATAHSIIRALRAYGRVSATGQWTEPPTRVIVSTAPAPISQPTEMPPLLDAARFALPSVRNAKAHHADADCTRE